MGAVVLRPATIEEAALDVELFGQDVPRWLFPPDITPEQWFDAQATNQLPAGTHTSDASCRACVLNTTAAGSSSSAGDAPSHGGRVTCAAGSTSPAEALAHTCELARAWACATTWRLPGTAGSVVMATGADSHSSSSSSSGGTAAQAPDGDVVFGHSSAHNHTTPVSDFTLGPPPPFDPSCSTPTLRPTTSNASACCSSTVGSEHQDPHATPFAHPRVPGGLPDAAPSPAGQPQARVPPPLSRRHGHSSSMASSSAFSSVCCTESSSLPGSDSFSSSGVLPAAHDALGYPGLHGPRASLQYGKTHAGSILVGPGSSGGSDGARRTASSSGASQERSKGSQESSPRSPMAAQATNVGSPHGRLWQQAKRVSHRQWWCFGPASKGDAKAVELAQHGTAPTRGLPPGVWHGSMLMADEHPQRCMVQVASAAVAAPSAAPDAVMQQPAPHTATFALASPALAPGTAMSGANGLLCRSSGQQVHEELDLLPGGTAGPIPGLAATKQLPETGQLLPGKQLPALDAGTTPSGTGRSAKHVVLRAVRSLRGGIVAGWHSARSTMSRGAGRAGGSGRPAGDEERGMLLPAAPTMIRSRIEPKTFFAAERTFLSWLNLSVLLMFVALSLVATAMSFAARTTRAAAAADATTIPLAPGGGAGSAGLPHPPAAAGAAGAGAAGGALLGSGGMASGPAAWGNVQSSSAAMLAALNMPQGHVMQPVVASGGLFAMCGTAGPGCKAALVSGLVVAPIAMLFMGYALWMYRHRTAQILRRETVRYDDQRGPVVLVVLLLVVLAVAYGLTVRMLVA